VTGDVRAITVRQPWAWAIARGKKNIENRSQSTKHRGTLLIHAGQGWSDRGAHDHRIAEACVSTWPAVPGSDPGARASIAEAIARAGLRREFYAGGLWSGGAVIAVAQLVDVHPDAECCRPWGESDYQEASGRRRTVVHHLVLEDVVPLDEPVPARGALGMWRPPSDVVDAVLAAAAAR
jgi:hypothetical protein